MMTLEEAIQHCREKANGSCACADDHRQLAEWLLELVDLREKTEIVFCKDCRKHNLSVDDTQDYANACPLVEYRGKAMGHEFDYQYCAYGKRKGKSCQTTTS